MRFIIYGVGAVGGAVAATLVRAGHEVVGIARGARLDAIRADGLTLRSPAGTVRVPFTCVAAPSEIAFAPEDVILLAMKSQDTAAALEALRAAGVDEQAVVCVQNGVAKERAALRLFPRVHGVTVMLPSIVSRPDDVVAYGAPNLGVFEIGRYPSGADATDEALAEALSAGGIAGFVSHDVMAGKYGKLLLNLGNVVEAALGPAVPSKDVSEVLREEGRTVLRAAGIAWRDVGPDDPRRDLMRLSNVPGAVRLSSSSQSLARQAGSIETDYLNGEIVLLAREHGIAAPANEAACRLAARLARDRRPPGSVSRDDLLARFRGEAAADRLGQITP